MGEACFKLNFTLPFDEVRALAHEAMDKWLDALAPLFEEGKRTTLKEFSHHFTATRSLLFGACMEAAIEKYYADELNRQWCDCPRCKRRLKRRRLDDKEFSTLHGRFVLKRPYFYCFDCNQGFHPLDDILEAAPENHQYDIQEQSTLTSAQLPFGGGAELFSTLTGISVGDHFQYDTLNAVGETATLENVIPDESEIEKRISQATGASGDPPVLVVASDGAHLPTRPKSPRKGKRGAGSYQEAKGFRLYLIDSQERIVQLASWHQIQDAPQFDQDLGLVASRIPKEKVRTALLGDGADWLWTSMTKHFPEGRQVLDFYHCSEHIHKVAKVQYGDGTIDSQQWAEAALVRLSDGEPNRVIGALKCMNPINAEAKEEIRKLIGYLENNKHRIDYCASLEKGFPIGSGGIESANKFICHTRMKRPGAWWVKENGNAMLRIRCAIYNGTFKRVFEKYIETKKA